MISSNLFGELVLFYFAYDTTISASGKNVKNVADILERDLTHLRRKSRALHCLAIVMQRHQLKLIQQFLKLARKQIYLGL